MEIAWDQTRPRDWERMAQSGGMQQAWAYGAACASLGGRVLRAEIRCEGRTIGLAQLIHRKFALFHASVCTRGPVWLDASADLRSEGLRALRRSLPLPWLRGLFVTPDDTETGVLRRAGLSRVMTPYTTAIIDLTRDAKSLRAAMHQKWRNRLSAAERAGLQIGRADRRPDRYRWLLDLESKQQKAERYAALPPAFVTGWQLAGGDVRVFTAFANDAPIAVMLFLLHGRRATYHIGWTNTQGRRHSAHNLILWRAILKLKAKGVAELDLGGLNTRDNPGIARFKLGAGAQPHVLCGTWFGR